MQPTSSLFARLGQGVSHACTRLQEAGAQFAATAAQHLERALASCRRPVRPAPHPAHEVAPPLRERQVEAIDFLTAQLRAQHAAFQIALENDPGDAQRLLQERIQDLVARIQHIPPNPDRLLVPRQMDDAPAANDHGGE